VVWVATHLPVAASSSLPPRPRLPLHGPQSARQPGTGPEPGTLGAARRALRWSPDGG